MQKYNQINEQGLSINHLLERYPIGKLLRIYALPAIFNMLVMAMYNVVDRVFIGQGAGAMAICGLALTLPCIALFSTIGTLTGVGAAAQITIAIGRNDYKRAGIILGNALFLTITLSAVLLILTLTFLEPVLYNFGGSELSVPYALSYLYVMIPAGIVANVNFTFSHAVRIAENRRKFMTIMLIGPIVNLFLDPLLIFGFNMGIEGAAYASLISMCVSLLLILLHFTTKNRKIHLGVESFIPKFDALFLIITIGMAAFIMHITTSMVNIIINRYLYQSGGDYAIGAFGIVGCMLFIVAAIQQGICQGMQPVLSYNYGCENRVRVKETLKRSIAWASVVSCVGFAIFEIFPEQIIRMFTNNANLVYIGTEALRYTALLLPVTGFQTVTANFFQSVNQPLKAIAINISRQFLFLIPALIILSNRFGLTGIWLATPTADLLVAIPTIVILLYSFRRGSCSKAKF